MLIIAKAEKESALIMQGLPSEDGPVDSAKPLVKIRTRNSKVMS
jgi:hypothetical protein